MPEIWGRLFPPADTRRRGSSIHLHHLNLNIIRRLQPPMVMTRNEPVS